MTKKLLRLVDSAEDETASLKHAEGFASFSEPKLVCKSCDGTILMNFETMVRLHTLFRIDWMTRR